MLTRSCQPEHREIYESEFPHLRLLLIVTHPLTAKGHSKTEIESKKKAKGQPIADSADTCTGCRLIYDNALPCSPTTHSLERIQQDEEKEQM